MNISKLINKLNTVSILKYIYWNYFSKKVIHKGKGKIIPYKNSVINVDKTSRIIMHDDNFYINDNKLKGSSVEAYVKLMPHSELEIHNKVHLCYQAIIECRENSKIEIGSAYINSYAVILAAKSIQIGNEVLISRNVKIYDADHHSFIGKEGEVLNPPKPVKIGNHVWIGLNCIVLRDSRIGDGCFISAGSLVGGKIKEGTSAFGNPARSYAEVKWE